MLKRMIVVLACAAGMYVAIMASARATTYPAQNTCSFLGCFSFSTSRHVASVKHHRKARSHAHKAQRHIVKARKIAPKVTRIAVASADPNVNPMVNDEGAYSYLVAKAQTYLGKTARDIGVRHSLWCAAFMNKLLGGGTHSDLAFSYRSYGIPAKPGCIGCIAVSTRRGGGHVGVVKEWRGGVPILISGNHGHIVAEGRPPGRIVALRWP